MYELTSSMNNKECNDRGGSNSKNKLELKVKESLFLLIHDNDTEYFSSFNFMFFNERMIKK